MIMGPQMNANARKCKTHRFVSDVRSCGIEFVYRCRDMCTQENNSLFIRVHLRTEIDMSELMNEELVTITVDSRELNANG